MESIYTSGSTIFYVATGVTDVIKDIGSFVKFFDEVRIHRLLIHLGVIHAYSGFIREDDRGVFITELAKGDLSAFMKKTVEPEETTKFSTIDQLINAVEFLHKCGLVHSDLKLLNDVELQR